MHCAKCGQKECRRSDLIAENERLRAVLLDAVQDIGDWASYADPYYHQKWGLEATLEKYKRIAAGEKE